MSLNRVTRLEQHQCSVHRAEFITYRYNGFGYILGPAAIEFLCDMRGNMTQEAETQRETETSLEEKSNETP